MPVTINDFEVVTAPQTASSVPTTPTPSDRPTPTEAEQKRQIERQFRHQQQRALRVRVY
jgi:hypothetical protein